MSKKKTKAQKRFNRQRKIEEGNITSSVEIHGNVLRIKQTYKANGSKGLDLREIMRNKI